MAVEIRVNEADLKRLAKAFEGGISKALNKILDGAGQLLAETMREKAPKRTGFLRESIRVHRGSDFVMVEPTAEYAPYVEYGTRPHLIVPVHARALRFEVEGRTVFARLVHHPGFPGRFFVRSTLEECLPKIHTIASQLLLKELS